MNIARLFNDFKTQDDCIKHLELVRWNNKPVCPYCKSTKSSKFKGSRYYTCLNNKCGNSYSVTVGTLFHDSKIGLQKWFLAISLILNAKKGISACQLMRDLDIGSYKTAWRMLKLIRKAMVDNDMRGYFTNIVEMDETYIGGKPPKFPGKVNLAKRGRGTKKQPVIGVMDRDNKKVYAKVATVDKDGRKLSGKQLMEVLEEVCINKPIALMTDEFTGYSSFKSKGYNHKVVDHSKQFTKGFTHTNTIESFWAILKRGVYGIYHKISAKYLQQYINEFCFRYNNRDETIAFDSIVLNATLLSSH